MARKQANHQLDSTQGSTGSKLISRYKLRGQFVFMALLISAILVFAGVLVVGQNLEVINVSGVWENTVLTNGGSASGAGTSSIRWGDPATTSGQSGYDFDQVVVSSIGPGSPVVIGRFNHLNFPIYPPSLSSAKLVITIVFNDPRITDPTIEITIPFVHDETGNGDDPCDYPEGPNHNGCADAVFIGTVASEPIVIGGIECSVDVWFGNGTDRYLTAESEENLIDLYLGFSCPSFSPQLTIQKSGPDTANVGDTITYSFSVTHAVTSDGSPVGELVVSDSLAGAATLISKLDSDQDEFLEDGETWTYQATYTIRPDDPGSLLNEGCVTGRDIDNDVVTACDTHTTTINQHPGIEVLKSGTWNDDGDGAAEVGEVISYEFTVTNTGDVTLYEVTISDPLITVIGGPLISLTVGASDAITFSGSYIVTQNDIDNGSRDNIATASGNDPNSDPVTDEAEDSVSLPQNPTIALVKTGSLNDGGDGIADVGDTIDYTFTVTNTGNVTLYNVDVTDPLVTVSGAAISLAPDEVDSTTFSGSYILTQTDIDNGSFYNIATATGTDPHGTSVEDDDDHTVTLSAAPVIEVVKEASYDTPLIVGSLITYTYTVTNTGNVTLTAITAVDIPLGAVTLAKTTLDPSESITGTLTYAVDQEDINIGKVDNDVTATGTPPVGDPVTDNDDESAVISRGPAIEVVKEASYDTPLIVGSLITYTYTVTNTGNVTLTAITAVDIPLGAVTLAKTTLDPNESTTGTLTYAVDQEDINIGKVDNDVTATGTPPVGDPVTDDDDESVALTGNPAIRIEKSTNGRDADSAPGPTLTVGDPITWTYVVTNTGNVTLSDIQVRDSDLGTVGTIATLAPGDLQTLIKTGTAIVGQYENSGSVTGKDPLLNDVSDTDYSHYFGSNPGIAIVKNGPASATIGESIIYTITIANTGNVTLHNVLFNDAKLGIVNQDLGDIAVGGSLMITPIYTVIEGDFPGPLENIATADSDETGPVEDTHSVEIPENPSVSGRAWADIDRNGVQDPGEVGIGSLSVRLLDETGTSILRSKITELDGTYIFNAVTPGNYVVDVDELDPDMPVGYTVTYVPTMPIVISAAVSNVNFGFGPEPIVVGTIGDYVWEDENKNGLQDETATGIANVRLILKSDAGTYLGETTTDSFGNYFFRGKPRGNYIVELDLDDPDLAGYTPTTSTSVPAVIASDFLDADFGVIRESPADLVVDKTVNEPITVEGGIVTFTITVTNDGPGNATGVVLQDTLPLGLAYIYDNGAGDYSDTSNRWEVGTLLLGASATLRISVLVEDGTAGTTIINTALVIETDVDDPDESNNEDSADVTVVAADLAVIKTVDDPTPAEGDTIVWTVTVTNGGPVDATGVVLSDVLPDGFTYLEDDGAGSYNETSGSWIIELLPVAASKTLNIVAEIDAGTAGTTITNIISVEEADQPDPDLSNNQDSVDVTVNADGGEGGTEACDGRVIISEIAWAGTAANPDDEWIELRNIGGEPIDLTGWVLRWRKKQPVTTEDFQWKTVPLSGELQASRTSVCELIDREPEPVVEFVKREIDNLSWFVVARPVEFDESYVLLERRSDLTISNVDANIVYDDVAPYWMELSNEGDIIELLDANGDIVDTANAFASYYGNWPAGNALTRGTMERIDPLGPDERDNWHTNLGIITRGVDADGRPLVASADVVNSQTLEEMELFADLNAVNTLPGARLEVGLDLLREVRRETGWPWIRVTRPGYDAAADDAAGGGGQLAVPVYLFAGRYSNDTYWLGIDTAGLVPGDYLVWMVYGEGQTVLVPIRILD